jgi:hypothetical protein
MKLSRELLLADRSARSSDPAFAATLNAHGLYRTMQFVLRLSPEVHRELSSRQSGITTNSKLGFDGAQAMSTYLHETVHWWQHIGSTYGFFLSLNYPMQAHATHFDLLKLVQQDGFKKSVVAQAIELNRIGPTGFGTTAGLANTIINNHYDLLSFRAFTLGPEAAKEAIGQPLFENVGHSLYITYGNTLGILAASVDREVKAIPDAREWSGAFRKLREDKVEGYYYGSPIGLHPIGAKQIFEGQACFSQIQYLSFACGHNVDLDGFRTLGLLHGIYIEAFEGFLRLSESEWPKRADDPLVTLFLLICDLAINPGSGFPFPIAPNYETFITDINPAARFAFFCRIVALQFPEFKHRVFRYDRADYKEISDALAGAMKDFPPLATAGLCASWFDRQGPLANLRKEYEAYKFEPGNFVIRHLFAHFLAFQEDKYKRPEFFCWPGAWMAGDNVSEESVRLFDKHGALFVDKEHDDGVFARLQATRTEERVQAVFKEFYDNVAIYDLANQWISEPGPFKYDLSWLSTNGDAKNFLRGQFMNAYQLNINEVRLI